VRAAVVRDGAARAKGAKAAKKPRKR
jgi:hypothetical protein